jgi:glycoside/pentoside/hexuronide:cation symporter, GPH family
LIDAKGNSKLTEELAEQDRRFEGKALSKGQKIIYASGNLPAALTIALIDGWILYFYSPPASKNLPIYLGVFTAGALNALRYVSNAVGDPVVGWWSDRTRSKMGRRRPFILYGTIFMCLVLVLIWFPPVQGISWTNNIVLGFYLVLFGFLYPLVVNPYLGLMPEITPYIKERINLSALMGYAEIIARVLAAGLTGVAVGYFMEHRTEFAGLKLDGYKVMALASAVITVVIYFLLVAKIKETPHEEKKEVPFGIFKSVVEVFKNPAFIPYIVIIATFILASNLLIMITPFFGTQVMGVSEDLVGLLLLILLAVAGLFFPLTIWVADKIGKKNTFVIAMFWFALATPLFVLVKLVPGINPKLFGFALYFIVAPPVSAVLVLQRPMISDCIDYDEKLTGFRRESMYMGAEGLITKLAWAASFLIAPGLMKFFGNTTDRPWGILLNGPVAALLLLAATLYYWKKYQFKR